MLASTRQKTVPSVPSELSTSTRASPVWLRDGSSMNRSNSVWAGSLHWNSLALQRPLQTTIVCFLSRRPYLSRGRSPSSAHQPLGSGSSIATGSATLPAPSQLTIEAASVIRPVSVASS